MQAEDFLPLPQPATGARAALRLLAAAVTLAAAAAIGCHEVHFEPREERGEILIYDDLYSVSTADGQHVIAVGYWGSAYYSEDGGDTWRRGETGTERLLYGVSMADDRRGWAVGQRGTILHTDDGGRTWTSQANPKAEQGTHLFAVHAIDANTAWVVGEWGTRLFTDNGGIAWEDRSLTIDPEHPQFVWLPPVEQNRVRRGEKVFEDVSLNFVYCNPTPSKLCWISGEFGYIFHSDNLGVDWERATVQGDIPPLEIGFEFNQVEVTDEQRAQLQEFARSILGSQHLNVEIEPFASERELALFGSEDDPTELFDILEARIQNIGSVLEEEGILSDRIRRRGRPPWDYEDFLEDDPGFLKRYLESRRSEKPYVEVRVSQNPYLFTVRFRDDALGWIAGLGGVILKSESAGQTWEYRKTGRVQALFSVDAANGRAVVVGEKGQMYVSTDAGDTWASPKKGFPRIFTFMRDVRFAPGSQVGFIVGQGGLVLRTRDGGATWDKVLPPPDSQLREAEAPPES